MRPLPPPPLLLLQIPFSSSFLIWELPFLRRQGNSFLPLRFRARIGRGRRLISSPSRPGKSGRENFLLSRIAHSLRFRVTFCWEITKKRKKLKMPGKPRKKRRRAVIFLLQKKSQNEEGVKSFFLFLTSSLFAGVGGERQKMSLAKRANEKRNVENLGELD